jgi:hypothetical protein
MSLVHHYFMFRRNPQRPGGPSDPKIADSDQATIVVCDLHIRLTRRVGIQQLRPGTSGDVHVCKYRYRYIYIYDICARVCV